MRPIRVTHINPTDTKGGASLAGYRLHRALASLPHFDSVDLVDEKYSTDQDVIKFSNGLLRQVERICNKIGYLIGLQYWVSVNWLPLLFSRRFWNTDVFLIRNIHGGMFPMWLPNLLSARAPVIWRFPDMWPLTGHCVYSYPGERWQSCCDTCNHQHSYPAIFLNSTRLLYNVKKFLYRRCNLYLVAPSLWMYTLMGESDIFKDFPRYHIPPGVDIDLFQPGTKRAQLTAVVISSSLKDIRKGGHLWSEIFASLNVALADVDLTLEVQWIGEADATFAALSRIRHTYLGTLSEAQTTKYLGSAHVHLLPTLADNLPNTILEALSCATPVVAFDVGGCGELVKDGVTGRLVPPVDITAFVGATLELLQNNSLRESCGARGRTLIVTEYSAALQAQRYSDLIQSLVQSQSR